VTKSNANLLRGTLDLLVLRALEMGPRHGYGILEWIERAVSPELVVEEGTLYPALHRMEDEGWIAAKWGLSENKRKAKYYRVTKKGAERAEREATEWRAYAARVGRALEGGQASP
jgi:transcriptional regulator